MNRKRSNRCITGLYALRIQLLIMTTLISFGCTQFQHQMPEVLPFTDRAQTKSDEEVRVTVAVPSAEETKQIFGFPLESKNIQPVWLKIQNNSKSGFFLFHVSMDPDIFSAGEVAWQFQSSFYSKSSQIS